MSEFFDYEATDTIIPEPEKKWADLRLVLLAVSVVAAFIVAGFMLYEPSWEKEYREYVQTEIIEQPDFLESCPAMHMFGLTGEKIAAMSLAQKNQWEGTDPAQAAAAAHIAGEMIATACGL